jgi:hypothetical protein
MAKLPSDAELAKLFAFGKSQKEIAEEYEVTIQAVNLRFHKIGLHRVPYARQASQLIDSIWPERLGREHHGKTAEMIFRAYVRKQLGDKQLSHRQELQAAQFLRVVTEKLVVLTYDLDAPDGWAFIPREDSDLNLVVRYPEGFRPAEGMNYRVLELKP